MTKQRFHLSCALLGALSLMMLTPACVGDKKKKEEGAPAASASAAVSGPSIAAVESAHDFGKVTEGDQLTHVFKVKNEGSALLTLDGVRTSCGCTAAILKAKEVKPGETADVEVKFDTAGRHGKNRKVITIESNDPKSPRTQLEVIASITPLLGFQPRYVRLTPEHGKVAEQKVELVGKLASDAKPQLVENPDKKDDVKVSLVTDEGKPPVVELSLEGKKVGLGSGRITLETGLEKPKQLTLRYSWQVRGSLQVSPSRPYFDPGRGLKERTIRVRSTQENFALIQAQIVQGPFTAKIEKPETGPFSYAVRVTLKEGAKLDAVSEGKLMLLSNDKLEPRKEIPLRLAPQRRGHVPSKAPGPGKTGGAHKHPAMRGAGKSTPAPGVAVKSGAPKSVPAPAPAPAQQSATPPAKP